MNGSSGRAVVVSDDLLVLIELALGAAAATEGAVDPTIGAALCGLGYDRDFADLAGGVNGDLPAARPVPGWRTVEVDRRAGTITAPQGTVLDLGATAKAVTADRIAVRVAGRLGCGVLVSLGGDIAVAGSPGRSFVVGVGDRCGASEIDFTVGLSGGGLASSGSAVRSWRLGRRQVHHIVDPATGHPAQAVWRLATVAAPSCLEANAASTAAMVRGAGAPNWLAARNLAARLVPTNGGHATLVAGWPGSTTVSHDARRERTRA